MLPCPFPTTAITSQAHTHRHIWTPTYSHAKAGRPARTYIQQLYEDTGGSSEDLPEVMNDREKWRERVKDICASGTTWWWWWWYIRFASSFLYWVLLSFIIKQSIWRCPWCNDYRHRIWTRRYEFNSWTRLIAFHIALIPLGKVWIQLFSLQLWVNSRAD